MRRDSIHELQDRSTNPQPPDSPLKTARCAHRDGLFLLARFREEPKKSHLDRLQQS